MLCRCCNTVVEIASRLGDPAGMCADCLGWFRVLKHGEAKERRNVVSLDWARRNREIARERAAEWARANPERRLEGGRRARAARPEAYRAKVRNRRAQLKVAGVHDADDILALYDLQRGRCNGCGWKLPASYHVDHVEPVSRGGSNGAENLQLLCPTCNTSKGARTMSEWLAVRAA